MYQDRIGLRVGRPVIPRSQRSGNSRADRRNRLLTRPVDEALRPRFAKRPGDGSFEVRHRVRHLWAVVTITRPPLNRGPAITPVDHTWRMPVLFFFFSDRGGMKTAGKRAAPIDDLKRTNIEGPARAARGSMSQKTESL